MILTLSCSKLFELKLRGMKNIFFYIYYDYGMNKTTQKTKKKNTPPGGLEPPTFRLTAERASRLRHGGCWLHRISKRKIVILFLFYNILLLN